MDCCDPDGWNEGAAGPGLGAGVFIQFPGKGRVGVCITDEAMMGAFGAHSFSFAIDETSEVVDNKLCGQIGSLTEGGQSGTNHKAQAVYDIYCAVR